MTNLLTSLPVRNAARALARERGTSGQWEKWITLPFAMSWAAFAVGCMDASPSPTAASAASAPLSADGTPASTTPAGGGSSVVPEDPSLDPSACREVVEALAVKLHDEYVFVEVADEMARALRATLGTDLCTAGRTARELSRRLTTELQALSHDKHLRVFYGAPMGGGPARASSENPGVGGVRKHEILEGNVGYLETTSLPPLPEAEAAIAAAFAHLHDTSALILDVRANGGGYPNTVARYVSYLSDGPPFVVNRFQWRHGGVEEFHTTDLGALAYGSKKPVFVLTSSKTFSGGEELAYDIQALKRGVLVGETTGGGANPGGPAPLGDGFVAVIPRGRAVNPITGSNWEGTGVKPDIAVPADQALTTAHAAALARLQNTGSAPASGTATNPAKGR